MTASFIFFGTFLICGFLIWHGIFITNLSQLLANKEIDHNYLGLPTYKHFHDLQYSLPTRVCEVRVWDNYVKFCTFTASPFCSYHEPPKELVWMDPYHYFVPLQIVVC